MRPVARLTRTHERPHPVPMLDGLAQCGSPSTSGSGGSPPRARPFCGGTGSTFDLIVRGAPMSKRRDSSKSFRSGKVMSTLAPRGPGDRPALGRDQPRPPPCLATLPASRWAESSLLMRREMGPDPGRARGRGLEFRMPCPAHSQREVPQPALPAVLPPQNSPLLCDYFTAEELPPEDDTGRVVDLAAEQDPANDRLPWLLLQAVQ